ncbi:hypothetical protein B0H34DRAFT_195244 [Crassisporium funariophilum]|nr:hypothetical protein B0H34DRAFT_195244 [Crassisporium funariophilum]
MMEQRGLLEPSLAYPTHETQHHHLQPPLIGPIGISGGVFSGNAIPIIHQGSGNIHNAAHHYHSHNMTEGMKSLHKSIAPGAFHNALERQDPPKCHASTREAVIRDIMRWVEELEKERNFMWVHGPAGAGKSAILQTIAELCHAAGLLGASFFFSRTAGGRMDADRLVATLVSQLCISIPEMRSHVELSLEQDPLVLSRSVEAQLESLLFSPFSRAACDPLTAGLFRSRPRLIILDGLDECGQPKTQRHLLTLLSGGALKLPVPLIFLIASRPEQQIRNAFISPPLVSTTSLLALDDSYLPDKDIEIFLRSKFEEIRQTHPLLSTSWPSAADISRLIAKSSGQFIYASTVIKYMDSPRHWPDERLEIIFKVRPAGKESPFAELDALYNHIFSCVENLEKVLEVLGSLLVWDVDGYCEYSKGQTTPRRVEKMLCLRHGDITTLFGDLSSIVYIPTVETANIPDQEIRILHASLGDFLLDESRSGQFHIRKGQAEACLALYSLRHIEEFFRIDPQFRSLSNVEEVHCQLISYDFLLSRCIQAEHTESLFKQLHGLDFSAFLDVFQADPKMDMHFRPITFANRILVLRCLPNYLKWLQGFQFRSQLDLYSLHLKSWEHHIKNTLLRLSGCMWPIGTNLITSLTLNSFNEESVKAIISDSTTLDEVRTYYDLLPGYAHTMLGISHEASRTMVAKYLCDPLRSGELCIDNGKYSMLSECFVRYVFRMDSGRDPQERQNGYFAAVLLETSYSSDMPIQNLYWSDEIENAYRYALQHLPFLLKKSRDSCEFADFLAKHPLPPDLGDSPAYPDRARVIDAIDAYITCCSSTVMAAQPMKTNVRKRRARRS